MAEHPGMTGRRQPWYRSPAALATALAVLAVLGAGAGITAGLVARSGENGGTGSNNGGSGSAPPSPEVSPSPSPESTCGAFREEFDSETLDPAWTSSEHSDLVGEHRIRDGWLEVSAKDGADLYPGYERPVFYTRELTGSYALQLRVNARPKWWYQGAGLLLLVDTGTYVRLEYGAGRKRGAIAFEYRVDGGNHHKVANPLAEDVPTGSDDVELRLVNRGTKAEAAWRVFGTQAWKPLGTAELKPDATYRAGLSIFNRSQAPNPDPKKRPFKARFAYVEATCG